MDWKNTDYFRKINHGWPLKWTIATREQEIQGKFVKKIQQRNPKKRILFVNSTWLGDATPPEVWNDSINQFNPDIIIISSLVDHCSPTFYRSTKMFNANELMYFGNFSGEYKIDFWSIIWKERHIPQLVDTNPTTFKYPFLCYNGKAHDHRRKICNELDQLGLINIGAVSFVEGNPPIYSPENSENRAVEESGGEYVQINDTMSLGDIDIWNTSFINIVTETVPNPVTMSFYSEKTWKPIWGMRPFLHYAEDAVNNDLQDLGFETFEQSFSDICDLDLNQNDNVALFCKVLSTQSNKYLVDKYQQLLPTLNHNRNRFNEFVKEEYNKIENF